MVVYLDVVMILNFGVDLLLLLGTNRLSGFPTGVGRCALGALLGSVYSGACMLPGFYFLGNAFWRMVCLTLMASVAFGWHPDFLRRCAVFIMLSLAMSGLAIGMGDGRFDKILLSALCVWLLCRGGFGGQLGQEYVPVSILDGERKISLMALKDTGNTLRDPITGEQVMVIGADKAEELTGLPAIAFSTPAETAVKHPGYRLIPYHAVGQPSGLLLAKRYPEVMLGKRRSSALIAFAPEIMDRGGMYQGLTGGTV